MRVRDRVDYSLGLVVVSLVLLVVPLFDMWEDVTVGGKSLLSTALENSIFVALALSLVGMSVWLLRLDWEETYVQLVARWSIFGTVVVALAYAWVLGFQLFVQNDLKPYVIAADGVVIGGIVMFVAGVFNARARRVSAERAAERDRFSALVDNTSDAVATVEFDGDSPVVTHVNEPFERTFGLEESGVVGRDAVSVLADRAVGGSSPAMGGAGDAKSRLRALAGEPDDQVEVRLSTREGTGDFLVDYVPVGDGAGGDREGFFVFTEITAQAARERQFETLNRGLEALLDARSVEGVVGSVRTLGVDLFEDAVLGVWAYDAESDTFRPHLATTTGPDGEPLEDPPSLPAVDANGGSATGPTVDAGALADRLPDVDDAVVGRLGDDYRLVIGRPGGDLSTTDRYLADLLVKNVRTAMERVDREAELARRNDQLEFVNSLLRHDIQNSMTIVRARGQALAESTTGREADYAETIVSQSDDVIDIVDRFRALLDALTGEGDGDLEPVSLSATVDDRVETLRTTHPDASVTVEAPREVAVLADDMLGNVLGNLLGNAVEHNDTDEPEITVTVTGRDHLVEVRIADDGPGIPDEQKDIVFRRGERGLKETDIGSGFGLFFVDTMMDRYGGSVDIEDNDPRGTVFVLTFRQADVDPSAAS